MRGLVVGLFVVESLCLVFFGGLCVYVGGQLAWDGWPVNAGGGTHRCTSAPDRRATGTSADSDRTRRLSPWERPAAGRVRVPRRTEQ
jgi:hypothetical protein